MPANWAGDRDVFVPAAADAGASAVVTTPEFVPKVTEATGGLDHVQALICTEAGQDGMLPLAVAGGGRAAGRSSPAPTTTWRRCCTPAARPAAPRA